MVDVALLGPVQAHQTLGPARLVSRERAVLAVLALRPERVVPVAVLIDRIWGEDPPETAANAVQVYVSHLRRALGRDALRSDPAGYTLAVPAEQVDVVRFERLAREGADALAAGRADRAARLLRAALGLWRGPALAGCGDAAFVAAEAARLEARRLDTVELRLEADLACGRARDVVEEARGYAEDHPFREGLQAALMTALYRSGRQAEALAAYRRARDLLAGELGLEPGPQLQALHKAMLAGDPALDMAPPAAAQRPIRTPPTPATALLGREHELAELVERLTTERLVTITGPGGVGKARLALAAARAAASAFADGVCWVPLAGLGDPAEVTPSLAHALGISDRGDRLLIETVGELLAERQLLVVLDNVEHLLPDAARLVGGLLAAAGDVVVLATSRAALHVAGEMRFPLAPLGLAALDLYEPHEVEAAPACALFLERARAVGRSMALTEATAVAVADLCARLDGLPLALELAAARTNVLSPGELLTRLNAQMLESSSVDAPARHRSLRATLQWSVDLLTPAEGRLLARLSVFRGGFTLDAAEAVVGTLEDLGAPTVDLLAELVDASLVVPADQETGRFAMLETIREFAADRLEAEEPAARAAHAAYYHRLFNPPDRVFPLWPRTPDEARRHALEQDNVRAAVAHAESVGDRMRLAGLATAVAGWRQVALLGSEADAWLRTAEANAPTAEAELAAMTLRGIVVAQSGDARAGRGPLEQALDHPAAGAAAHWRAAAGAQYALVLSLMTEGGDARVAGLVQDSLRMARGVDDPALLAFTLTCSGGAVTEFDVPLARALLEEAAAVGRDGPSHMSWFMAASNLAELELSCGDPIAARAWASTALDVEILRWAPTQRGYPLDLLGASLLALGQPDAAEPPLREALRLADWAADAGLLYEVVARFAALAAVRGDAPRAFTLLAAHQAGLDRHGIVRSASSRWLLGALIGDLGAADEERSRYEARGRGMSRPELVRYVLDGPPEGPSCQ